MFRVIFPKRGHCRPLERLHFLSQLNSPRSLARDAPTCFVTRGVQRAHDRKKLRTRVDRNSTVSVARRCRRVRFCSWRLRVSFAERDHEHDGSEARIPCNAVIVYTKTQSVTQSSLEFTGTGQPSQETPSFVGLQSALRGCPESVR